jgi:hypothetical protein
MPSLAGRPARWSKGRADINPDIAVKPKRALDVGRVRSFDTKTRCGVLGTVTGEAYSFERTRTEREFRPVARGDMVTFDRHGPESLNRVARNVQATEH